MEPIGKRLVVAASWSLATSVLLLVGCGGDGGGQEGQAELPRPLNCERQDYPCSLGEVPPEILQRSDDITLEAAQSLAAGASMRDVFAQVSGLDGVIEAGGGDTAFWFRLEGGRPTWVLTHQAETGDLLRGVPGGRPRGSLPPINSAVSIGLSTALWAATVGEERPKRKKALILSPFLWQWGATDEGAKLLELLENTRGYKGRVSWIKNEVDGDDKVQVDHFRNWGEYDVVHVATHGVRECAPEGLFCRSALATGLGGSACLRKPFANVTGGVRAATVGKMAPRPRPPPAPKPRTGLPPAVTGPIPWEQALAAIPATSSCFLGDDFFGTEYLLGLEQTIVYLNACTSAQGTEFDWALAGDSSVMLGWDRAVSYGGAYRAALSFYQSLREGFTTGTAFKKVEDQGLRRDQTYGAYLRRVSRGDDLRAREVVWLIDERSGREVKNNAVLPSLSRPGLIFQVDGVEEDQDKFELHLSVNGQEVPGSYSLDRRVSDHVWQASANLDLSSALDPGDVFDLEPWVKLPEGGTSRWVYEDLQVLEGGCSVLASWTGDFSGSVQWTPEVAPNFEGFAIRDKQFSIDVGRFVLRAEFPALFVPGQTGTFSGKASNFYVTDAPFGGTGQIGFPNDVNTLFYPRTVPVTLTITEWNQTPERINGTISIAAMTATAMGPGAPTVPGPGADPLKPITVSGSAQFQASGELTIPFIGTMCHKG